MKTLRKVFAIILVICMIMSLTSLSAFADRDNNKDHQNSSSYEYIQLLVNGVAWDMHRGENGAHTWLIQGTYSTRLDFDEDSGRLNYTIGKQTGSFNLPIPEGATNISVDYRADLSVNSSNASFDYAVITLTFTEATVGEVTYHPGSTSITVTKAVEGKDASLSANQFSFTLTETDASWTPISGGHTASATNDASGNVTFPAISYNAEGTHYYIVSEVNDAQENWTYSNHIAQITVDVTSSTSADGLNVFIWAGASYNNGRVFTNTYAELPPPYVPVHTPGSVTVTKTASGAEVPADALFTLYKGDEAVASVKYADFVDGSYTFTGLEEGEYTVIETGAEVDGFNLSAGNSGAVSLTTSTADNGDTTVSSGTVAIANTYTEIPPPYVPVHTLGSVTVVKTTSGAEVPADTIFTLYKGDEAVASVKYADFVDGSYTFTDLEEGEYSVIETGAAVDGFDLTVSNSGAVSLTKSTADNGDTAVSSGAVAITNAYTELPPPYVPVHTLGSVTVVKTASGTEVPADTIFTLYKGDEAVASAKYADFVDGSYTFTGLEEGEYSVIETGAAVDGFDLTVSNSGAVNLTKSTADNGDTTVSSGTVAIANSYSLIPIDITVSKSWVDNNDALGLRPDSIEIVLHNGGEEVATAELSETNGWTHSFTGLDAAGSYTVDEVNVPAGYTKAVNGYAITNTLNSIAESGDPVLPGLTVNKTDNQGNALAGAVFTLTDGSYTATATSGADGVAFFSNIPAGSYILSETTAPQGYKATDATWEVKVSAEKDSYSLSVGSDGIINKVWGWITSIFVDTAAAASITVVNEPIPVEPPAPVVTPTPVDPPAPVEPPAPALGKLVIVKQSNGLATPADTIFTVTGPNGYKQEIRYGDFRNGSYSLELEPGTYTVNEVNAEVEDYNLMVKGGNTNVVIAANDEARVLIVNTYTAIAPPIPEPLPEPLPEPEPPYVPVHTTGSVTVVKTAAGAAVPADARFTLYKGNVEVASAVYADFVNGSYTFTGLEEGEYSVVESNAAVEGFDLDVSSSGAVTLSKSTADNGDTTVSSGTVAIANRYTELPPPYVPVHTPGTITVTKITAGTIVPADATFTLYKGDVEVVSAVYADFVNGSYTFTGLEEGEYTVVETNAAVKGFELKVDYTGAVTLSKSTAENGDTTISSGTVEVTNTYTAITPNPPQVPITLDEIPDEEVPLAQAPQTGDSFLFWLAAAFLSAIGLAYTSLKLRRNED